MKPYLPPLPKVPGAEDFRPLGESILDVLATEHRFLEAMCADVRDGRDRADVLVAVLCRHLSAERQYFYPTVVKAVPGRAPAADERRAADGELLAAATALMKAATPEESRRAVAELRVGIAGHRAGCEGELFAALSAALSPTDLVRLGNRVEMALESAPSRPHLGAPMRTPWNKLTDPVIGAVDKLHDLVTGRSAYPPSPQEADRKRLRTRHIAITQS